MDVADAGGRIVATLTLNCNGVSASANVLHYLPI